MKTIYQKLLVIQTKINGLGKDKASNSYSYVTGSKVLEHIKPLMNELGLILKQEVLSIENERMDYLVSLSYDKSTNLYSGGKPKSEILSKVMMRFTWIDTESGEKDENLFGANGQNDWEKGLGSALTYAERYFLLKYFHIATDEDDIDNPNRDKKETTPNVDSDLKWLNILDKDKNSTKEWINILDGIKAKKINSVADVRKFYKVSKEVETSISEHLKTLK